jgi:hypothetical protein
MDRSQKPIFIMLTDSKHGVWQLPETRETLQKIMLEELHLPVEEQVTLHMFGFGDGVNETFIRTLADIGNGSYLNCGTQVDADRVTLVKAFMCLASEPAVKVSLQQQVGPSHART